MALNKNKAYWLCQIVGWSIYGLLSFGVYLFLRGTFDLKELVIVILQIFFYVLSTHLLRAVIKRKEWASLPIVRLIPVVLFSNLFCGLTNYLLLILASYFMGILVLSVELKTVNILFGVLGPAAIYFLWSMVYFAYHFFIQYNKSLQYEAVIMEAELQHLRAQLNPHFIFNALNSIKALIDENPKKSKKAISQLSSIFRNTLSAEKKQLVSLEKEMETVNAYLGLEKIRFEERLNVVMNLEQETMMNRIPPMMVQTLVENGVKHGISRLKDGGTIEISSYNQGGNLILQIRNNGTYSRKETLDEGHGTGLINTIDRLSLIYHDKASLKIINESENVVLTEIIIPHEY